MKPTRIVQLLILWLLSANLLVSLSSNPPEWLALPSLYVSIAVFVLTPLLALGELIRASKAPRQQREE
jgi:hypothetical protein